MEADLIHAGAVIAFGGYTGSIWAAFRSQKAGWVIPVVFFLLATAVMAAWH